MGKPVLFVVHAGRKYRKENTKKWSGVKMKIPKVIHGSYILNNYVIQNIVEFVGHNGIYGCQILLVALNVVDERPRVKQLLKNNV